VCESVRSFMDSMCRHMASKRVDSLRTALTDTNGQSEDGERRLVQAMEWCTEQAVLPPLLPRIWGFLGTRDGLVADEALVLRQMARLHTCSQDVFQIPENCRSRSDYRQAVVQLNALDEKELPDDKLEALIKAANTVFEVHAAEHVGSAVSVSGDDFLPIFAFVLARSSLLRPLRTCTFLWALCASSALSGEGGCVVLVCSHTQ
jgi:hypothetical protein